VEIAHTVFAARQCDAGRGDDDVGNVSSLLPLDISRPPYLERLRNNARITAALSAITAAVVGVVLNLAVWFGWQVLVPGGAAVNWAGMAIALVAFIGMQRWKWEVIPVVGGAAGLGLLRHAVGW
jgi:hypothetical protein